MNLVNIIEGIERLVIGLLFWIVFIPKTIFKIVVSPSWASNYVTSVFAEDSKRFKDFMSPVILYLLNTVFLLLAYVHIKRDVLKESLSEDNQTDEIFGDIISNIEISDNLLNTLSGSFGLVAATIFLSIPLFFALIIEWSKRKKLNREGLTRVTYIQCYYFSPLALSYAAIFYADVLLEDYLLIIAFLLFIFFVVWFVLSQIRFISEEHEIKKKWALLLFVAILSGALLTTSALVSAFVAFDEDKGKVTGTIEELVLKPSKEDMQYTVLVKCPDCDSFEYSVEASYSDKEKVLIDPNLNSRNPYLSYPGKNETYFSVEPHDEEISIDVYVKSDSDVEFYVDILDEENHSILGGIRSQRAKKIRAIASYILFAFMAIMVLRGLFGTVFNQVFKRNTGTTGDGG